MPYKKRLHARFPPARIKKIMQMDEEVGKVSSPVPVMVSRALERFLEYIMTSSAGITTSKDAKTLTPQHILQVIENDTRLHFIKEAAVKSCSAAANSSSNGGCGSSAGNVIAVAAAAAASESSKKSTHQIKNPHSKKSLDEENDDDDESDEYD